MRTVGGLHQQMLERDNLLRAVHQAAQGRRAQPAVQEYLGRLEVELQVLREQMASGHPHCGEGVIFTIHDPKQRLITAPVFRERVLHHAVMNVCGPVLERRLCHHTYACRAGKGTVAALHAAGRAACGSAWFLKLDVRKYFESIPHAQLRQALERVFRERGVVRLLMALVSAYRPGLGHGLAIGTLVSQHLANFYLAAMDTHVLQNLRPSGYVRYMDDMALWAADNERLRKCRDDLRDLAHTTLGLEFKIAFINRTARGMDFLGHRVFPFRLGLNHASRSRYQAKARALHEAWAHGRLSESQAQERATALTAFTTHARCLEWRRRVLQNLGDGPEAENACCVAAAGSTTAGTPILPSATGTRRTTVTTTSAFVPVPAPADCRSALMEQARLPAPPRPAAYETHSSRRRPVTPVVDAPVATADGGSAFLTAQS
ncbi:MAG: reverse transcriptase domain-containing protein [Prosthecobacter sp.]